MANNTKCQEILLKVLEDVKGNELKTFQEHLIQGFIEGCAPIPKDLIEGKTLQEMIQQLIKLFGRSATTKITEVALVKMNQTQLSLQVQEALKKGGLVPRVPYVEVLPEDIKNQTPFIINGQPKLNADRFHINFQKGDDVAFHFNPRFNVDGQQVIVRNSRINSVWQTEERELPFFPFTPGKPFEIKIFCTSSEFIVEVDKKHVLNFAHRMKDIENLTTLIIEGDIDVEHVLGGRSVPKVPYKQVLPEGLKNQALIIINGQPNVNADRFHINFQKGDDVAFQFNPRFNVDGQQVIVRNHKIKSVWQTEERELPFFPFTPGKPFEMKILCTSSEFIVEVDNKHVLNFRHRTKDIENLTMLTVQGDVNIEHVFTGSLVKSVPYVELLPEGLKNQTCIIINGQPKLNADRFQINFQKGDDVAFHFNPRFNVDGQQVIVRNSRINSVWQTEERELPFFPFTPGKPFEIKIFCSSSEFIVEVDNKRVLNFTHRMKDIENLTTLAIEGDVDVKHILTGR